MWEREGEREWADAGERWNSIEPTRIMSKTIEFNWHNVKMALRAHFHCIQISWMKSASKQFFVSVCIYYYIFLINFHDFPLSILHFWSLAHSRCFDHVSVSMQLPRSPVATVADDEWPSFSRCKDNHVRRDNMRMKLSGREDWTKWLIISFKIK